MRFSTHMGIVVASLAVIFGIGYLSPAPAQAASDGITIQNDCDSGNASFTWTSLGLNRPVISSLTIDGETITDPANPSLGSIGATICASQDKGRMVGLSVYRNDPEGNSHQDLTGALTPAGNPITTNSKITMVMTNLGSLAKYYTFSLVHGHVVTWTTANLGTDSASLTVSLTPVRNVLGTGDDFGSCTATPPTCNAAKADAEILGVGLAMTFDQGGYGTNFAGSYFGLTSAMGGFVESKKDADGANSLIATLGAPHKLSDGITSNVGSLQAFLPTTVLESLFGLPAGGVDTSAFAITRTESDTTSSVPFTVTAVTGGVVVGLDDITFSTPVYTIKKSNVSAAASASSTAKPTAASSSKASTTSTLTPDKDKSSVRVDGQNIMANGTSSYRVVMTVRDKNNTAITDQKPVLNTTEPTAVKMSDPVLVGGEWMSNITSTASGEKTITIKVGNIQLISAAMTFASVVPAASASPASDLTDSTASYPTSSIMFASIAELLGLVLLAGLGFWWWRRHGVKLDQ